MSNSAQKEATLKQIFDFVHSNGPNNYSEARQGLLILLDKYAKIPEDDQLQAITPTERLAEIKELTNNENITLSVNWDMGEQSLKFLDNNCFVRIVQAFRLLCSDEIAINEVKRIQNINISYSETSSLSISNDGVLSISGNFESGSNCPSANEISQILESELRITFLRQYHKLFNIQLPIREKEILESIGINVKLTVAKDNFKTPSSLEFLDNVGGLRLLMAIRTSQDPIAKDLVSGHLKLVEFVNVNSDVDYKVLFEPKLGKLTLSCQYDRTNADSRSNILNYQDIYNAFTSTLSIKAAQKRKELCDKLIPERQEEVIETLGLKDESFTYIIEWDTFPSENELNYIDNAVCHRVSMALRCISEEVQTRFSEKIKSIRIINFDSKVEGKEKSLAFNNDKSILILTVDLSIGLSGAFSDGDIRAYINSNV